ncbi:hypothetical protein TNCT_557461 [Trichonephila clavata]|uniref:Uncharacterized protein n=1 Tax=Trichonephila clavata TaxID=2740835 RepID=A0A8X6LPM2_TRICU|nr:hypothetical protein TNCT_557461 [Trichonephila clavata]
MSVFRWKSFERREWRKCWDSTEVFFRYICLCLQDRNKVSDFVRRRSTLREKGGRQTKGKGSSGVLSRRVQFWGGGLTQKHATVVRGLARRVSVGQPRGRGKVSAQSTTQNIRTRSLGTGIALSCTSGSAETHHLLPLGSRTRFRGYGIAEPRSRSHVQSSTRKAPAFGEARQEL